MITPAFSDIENKRNDTFAGYPKAKALPYFLNKCAIQYPDKTAIKFNGIVLTYRELYESSNKLAKILIDEGIKSGGIVAVALDRSPAMIISLLAVLKSGAAYLPLDPDFPKDRVEFMLEDSSAKILLTSQQYHNHFQSAATEVLIEDAWDKFGQYLPDELEININSENVAYVLYTSGSTGKPKGVQVKHYNLVNFLLSMQKEPGMNADDKLLAITTISFDIAGLELYLPLICGAQILLADKQALKDGRLLLDLVKDEKVSFMQATPYTWRMMLEAGWNEPLPLKILCGGEALPKDLVSKLLGKCAEIWNMYGPTETTIWSTVKLIESDENISIGRPIANTQVYILDEALNNLTNGTIGEIFIAGDGVAKGYLNRPELTAERFIDNSFSDIPNDKMYRTGDLGRLNESGDIQCMGRIDHQVKVRGYRIELEEIEHILLKQTGVKEAVVIAREDNPGDPSLVAYIVLNETEKADFTKQITIWRKALLAELPEYMVPDDFLAISAIPVTPNGKTDRKSLPKPDYSVINRSGEYVAPRTDVEQQVSEIWQELMGLEKISIFDNFFALGGRSLVAVQIMARIEKLTGKRLPLATLFEHSTIEKLSLRLNVDAKSITWDSLVPIKPKGSKMPLYIVHGAGLNVLLFNALAMNMNEEQPVYGLQAKGLNGVDEPLDVMEEIAANYIAEILAQNPNGPYALAGYSLGGTIAYEMAHQLIAMDKEVKLLAVFDTYAKQTNIFDPFLKRIFTRVRLSIMKVLYSFVLFAKDPKRTFEYKTMIIKRRMIRLFWKISKDKEEKQQGFFAYDNEIDESSAKAKRNYFQKPLDITVDVFRAKKKTFYMQDFKYLGWREFALKGVNVHDIPGEHNTIFAPPNDEKFAVVLQQCLDRVSKES